MFLLTSRSFTSFLFPSFFSFSLFFFFIFHFLHQIFLPPLVPLPLPIFLLFSPLPSTFFTKSSQRLSFLHLFSLPLFLLFSSSFFNKSSHLSFLHLFPLPTFLLFSLLFFFFFLQPIFSTAFLP